MISETGASPFKPIPVNILDVIYSNMVGIISCIGIYMPYKAISCFSPVLAPNLGPRGERRRGIDELMELMGG
jgi:hypothetical protein